MVKVKKTWKMDENWDLDIDDDGRITIIESEEKVQQDAKYTLSIMPGEDIFHPNFGTNLDALKEARTNRVATNIIKDGLSQYQ